MYRSQEIIRILSIKNLTKDIIEYILNLERKQTFEDSIYQMIYHSYQ